MNRIFKAGIVSLLSLVMCSQAMAAFVLNGTRYIYEEGKNNTSFEVTNQASDTFGGQVWIDNTIQGNGVYMVPAPPFFKIAPNEKQIVRIMKTDSGTLPKDKESLFWLNIQEIPPVPKDTDGGVLAVAVNTKVKLFYRPKSLIKGREGAEKYLQICKLNGNFFLKNPTPYYFAITGIKVNGHSVKLSDNVLEQIAQLAPKSEVSLGKVSLNGKISVDAVNDWGGVESYNLSGDNTR